MFNECISLGTIPDLKWNVTNVNNASATLYLDYDHLEKNQENLIYIYLFKVI